MWFCIYTVSTSVYFTALLLSLVPMSSSSAAVEMQHLVEMHSLATPYEDGHGANLSAYWRLAAIQNVLLRYSFIPTNNNILPRTLGEERRDAESEAELGGEGVCRY